MLCLLLKPFSAASTNPICFPSRHKHLKNILEQLKMINGLCSPVDMSRQTNWFSANWATKSFDCHAGVYKYWHFHLITCEGNQWWHQQTTAKLNLFTKRQILPSYRTNGSVIDQQRHVTQMVFKFKGIGRRRAWWIEQNI